MHPTCTCNRRYATGTPCYTIRVCAVQPARVTVHPSSDRGLPQRTVILIKFHAEVMAREKV